MNIIDIQNEIIRLKKEKDICILAHSYQAKEILAQATVISSALTRPRSAIRTSL